MQSSNAKHIDLKYNYLNLANQNLIVETSLTLKKHWFLTTGIDKILKSIGHEQFWWI